MPPGEAYCALSTAICCRDDGDRRPETTASALLTPLLATAVSRRPRRRSRRRARASGRFASRQAGEPARTAPRPAPPAAPGRWRRTHPPGRDTCCPAWAQRGIGNTGGEARTRPVARRSVLLARLEDVTVCSVVTLTAVQSRGPVDAVPLGRG